MGRGNYVRVQIWSPDAAAPPHSRQVINLVTLSQCALVDAARAVPHTEQVPAYGKQMMSVATSLQSQELPRLPKLSEA